MAAFIYMILTLQIFLYKTDDLTYEILVSRTPDMLIIEESTGTILDKEGHGKIDTKDPKYNYISYVDLMEYAEPGQKVTTYSVFNPDTTYEDDMIFRIDILEDGNVFFTDCRIGE